MCRLVELYRSTSRPAAPTAPLSPLEVSTYSKLELADVQDVAVEVGVRASLASTPMSPVSVTLAAANLKPRSAAAPGRDMDIRDDVKIVTMT